ncbi:MAG: hypothetical protein WAR22_11575 [Desulfomonilia bacterium]|jgi:hypothetical protein
MSIHRGSSSLRSRSNTVEITTTLFELMEAMDEIVSSGSRARLSGTGARQAGLNQDREIAETIAGLFVSGKLRFKRPRDIEKAFPEWFD